MTILMTKFQLNIEKRNRKIDQDYARKVKDMIDPKGFKHNLKAQRISASIKAYRFHNNKLWLAGKLVNACCEVTKIDRNLTLKKLNKELI